MKTVVITGGAKDLGLEIAKCFRNKNFNVIISDTLKKEMYMAKKELLKVKGIGDIDFKVYDITKKHNAVSLINEVKEKYGTIDFWINNVGINEIDKMITKLSSEEIKSILDAKIDDVINTSRLISKVMIEQDCGSIYNALGYGSKFITIQDTSIYETALHKLDCFTKSLAKELSNMKADVMVGKLSPGIIITDFLTKSNKLKKIELSPQKRQIYNTFGDYPDVVAKFLVNKMIINTNNNIHIKWLTNRRILWKSITSKISRRDFFKDKQ